MELISTCLKAKIWILIIMFFLQNLTFSQIHNAKNPKVFLGFNYGYGSHDRFPVPSRSYKYNTNFYKLQLNYILSNKKQFGLAINLEPSYYYNTHQSLSKQNQEKNTIAPKEKINEYALNIGLQTNYNVLPKISLYFLASTGPTITNVKTERLSKGLSFSNILGIGVNYKSKPILFDLRCSIRHVSNASLKKPNRGYNSLNFETGFSIPIK